MWITRIPWVTQSSKHSSRTKVASLQLLAAWRIDQVLTIWERGRLLGQSTIPSTSSVSITWLVNRDGIVGSVFIICQIDKKGADHVRCTIIYIHRKIHTNRLSILNIIWILSNKQSSTRCGTVIRSIGIKALGISFGYFKDWTLVGGMFLHRWTISIWNGRPPTASSRSCNIIKWNQLGRLKTSKSIVYSQHGRHRIGCACEPDDKAERRAVIGPARRLDLLTQLTVRTNPNKD